MANRSQLIWIYTVCKGRVYPGSAGQGLRKEFAPKDSKFFAYRVDHFAEGTRHAEIK